MNEQLLEILKEFGVEGLQAFYINMALDYGTVWTIIGLIVWAVRTFWKHEKQNGGW